MKLFYILIILSMFFACSSNNHWTEFRANGLPESGEKYEDILFVNDSMGYLGGSKMIETGNNQFKAVLYQTKDRGKSWNQIPLDYRGKVEKIFTFQDTLTLLLQGIPSDTDTNYIVQSINKGKNWKEIFSYSSKDYVRDIYFNNAESGGIIFDKGNKRHLLKYQGNKWDTILTLPQNIYGDHIYKNQVISIQPEGNTANTSGILITEISSRISKEIHFDKPYFISTVTKTNDALFIGAQETNSGKIIRYSKNHIEYISLGKYSNYFPEKIFGFDNKILIIASRAKDATILGVTHSLLISEDNGKTWTLEKLPSEMMCKPAFLYRDRFFITYTLMGALQIRTF